MIKRTLLTGRFYFYVDIKNSTSDKIINPTLVTTYNKFWNGFTEKVQGILTARNLTTPIGHLPDEEFVWKRMGDAMFFFFDTQLINYETMDDDEESSFKKIDQYSLDEVKIHTPKNPADVNQAIWDLCNLVDQENRKKGVKGVSNTIKIKGGIFHTLVMSVIPGGSNQANCSSNSPTYTSKLVEKYLFQTDVTRELSNRQSVRLSVVDYMGTGLDYGCVLVQYILHSGEC